MPQQQGVEGRRHEDDRQVRVEGPDFVERPQAAQARHENVEQHRVRPLPLHFLEGL